MILENHIELIFANYKEEDDQVCLLLESLHLFLRRRASVCCDFRHLGKGVRTQGKNV